MTDFNEAVFTDGSTGTPGSQGNDGYGGLNLFRYSYDGPGSDDMYHGFDSNGWFYGYSNNLLWTNGGVSYDSKYPEEDKIYDYSSIQSHYGICFGQANNTRAEIVSGEDRLGIVSGKTSGFYYFGTQGAFDGDDITSSVVQVSETQGANITYTYVKINGVHLNAVLKSMHIYKDCVHYSAYVTERIVSAVYGEEIP